MAKDEELAPKGVLTKSGYYKASNFLLDLLRPKGNGQPGYRKDAITFIRDQETGHIKELGTGKICEVRYLKEN